MSDAVAANRLILDAVEVAVILEPARAGRGRDRKDG
jgi:hypothetical protein